MQRLLLAALVACLLVLVPVGPARAKARGQTEPDPQRVSPQPGDADIGRAVVAGRHHTDVAREAAAAGAPGGFSRVDLRWQARDGARRQKRADGGTIALSVYIVEPIAGRVRAGQVLQMYHVGATTLAGRVDFFDIHIGYLEHLIHAALTPAQRQTFRNGASRYEIRFMASTDHSIGALGVRGPLSRPPIGADGDDQRPDGLPPLVMIGDNGRDQGRTPTGSGRDHDPARTICSSAFGSAFWPAGLQIRDVFTADPRAELAYVKTSPTAVARVRYSSSDRTAVDVGAALWGVNLDFATQKTVAKELTHTYTTSAGTNQHRAITTTLYARQFLLRCMVPNPFHPVIELTRPHMYAEYHAEAAEGLVPRGRTPHRWLFSCRGQFKTSVGSRDSGGTWAQHRSTELSYQNAVRLRPGGTSTFVTMDLRQRVGRQDEVTIAYEKVHRGQLAICGFNFKIPSQSTRVRAQGSCNPKPCEPVRY